MMLHPFMTVTSKFLVANQHQETFVMCSLIAFLGILKPHGSSQTDADKYMDFPSNIPYRDFLKQINSYNLMFFIAITICIVSIMLLKINLEIIFISNNINKPALYQSKSPDVALLFLEKAQCLEELLLHQRHIYFKEFGSS